MCVFGCLNGRSRDPPAHTPHFGRACAVATDTATTLTVLDLEPVDVANLYDPSLSAPMTLSAPFSTAVFRGTQQYQRLMTLPLPYQRSDTSPYSVTVTYSGPLQCMGGGSGIAY